MVQHISPIVEVIVSFRITIIHVNGSLFTLVEIQFETFLF